MIIIKLQGGLGNQLFQYAYGRALADKYDQLLYLDCTFLENRDDRPDFTYRSYELGDFNIRAEIAPLSLISSIAAYPTNRLASYKQKLLNWTGRVDYVFENNFSFEGLFKIKRKITYLSGFWQSEKYFKNTRNVILKDTFLKNVNNQFYQQWLNKISNSIAVSIHIRRGDYVNNETHPICNMGYYQQAIDLMKTSISNPTFFIFSDDINWAKTNLIISSPHFFVNSVGSKSYVDLLLMSKCFHNIIANSTYSWWAAWLNINPGKIVISPKKWFNDVRSISDLIPVEWKTI